MLEMYCWPISVRRPRHRPRRGAAEHRALTGHGQPAVRPCRGLLIAYRRRAGRRLRQFGSLSLDDFVLAVASLGLLCLVGFTSWVVVRQRPATRAWFVLHLVSYAALAISIPHQFSMSGMFASGPARWYWMGFIAVTAFCLLAFRVLTPAFNNLEHRLFMSSVEPAGPQVVNIYLSGRRLHELDVKPGSSSTSASSPPGCGGTGTPSTALASSPACRLPMRITVRNPRQALS